MTRAGRVLVGMTAARHHRHSSPHSDDQYRGHGATVARLAEAGVPRQWQERTWEAGGNTTKRARHARQRRGGIGVNRALALPPEEAAELALAGRLLGTCAIALRWHLGGRAEGRQARVHANGRRRGACRCRHVRCGEVRGRQRSIHLHKPRTMRNPVFALVSTRRGSTRSRRIPKRIGCGLATYRRGARATTAWWRDRSKAERGLF